MRQNVYLRIVLLLFLTGHILTGRAEKVVLFPVCPQNSQLQSERINNLHVFIYNAAQSVKDKPTEFLMDKTGTSGCLLKTNRTVAASLNSDLYLDATYLITGDSVELKMRLVYTRFVDKVKPVSLVKSTMQTLNDAILVSCKRLFTDLKVVPSTDEWAVISKMIKTDGEKYNGGNGGSPDPEVPAVKEEKTRKNEYFNLGKAAFDTDNFTEAISMLTKVTMADPDYPEAQFILGKAYVSTDDYNKAYICFRKSQDLGFADKSLESYSHAASLLSKPAEWFNTLARRKNWWLSLSNSELKTVLSLMNALRINGKTFDEKYVYLDDDLAKLFRTTILPLKHMKLQNLEVFRYFTDVDVMILENTKLTGDDGLQYLFKLKIVRTDNKIDSPQLTFLEAQKKITVIHTKTQK